jgi:hypothetical protein
MHLLIWQKRALTLTIARVESTRRERLCAKRSVEMARETMSDLALQPVAAARLSRACEAVHRLGQKSEVCFLIASFGERELRGIWGFRRDDTS